MPKTVYFTRDKVMFRNKVPGVRIPVWGAEGKLLFPDIPGSSFSFSEQTVSFQ
jgi:hypothetical protein